MTLLIDTLLSNTPLKPRYQITAEEWDSMWKLNRRELMKLTLQQRVDAAREWVRSEHEGVLDDDYPDKEDDCYCTLASEAGYTETEVDFIMRNWV